MTECSALLAGLAFNCRSVKDGVLYVESPHAYGFDGQLIGGYLIDKPNNKVKVTDNAGLLFQAMVSGVNPHRSTASRVRRIAESHGLELSQDGEIFAFAKPEDVPALMARLFETSIKAADLLGNMIDRDVSKFEKTVGVSLRKVYGKAVRSGYKETGASGHQLSFPLAIVINGSARALVQTISSANGQPNWASVYNTVGKMLDLKGANEEVKRFAILQTASSEGTAQAKKVLSQSATVLLFENKMSLPSIAA